MKYTDIVSLNNSIAYISDCCLATVEELALKSRRNKKDFERHIRIAQKACDLMKEFKVDYSKTRAIDIINITTVENWAKELILSKE
jgi:hypothetical protein